MHGPIVAQIQLSVEMVIMHLNDCSDFFLLKTQNLFKNRIFPTYDKINIFTVFIHV